jgi:hypothetical protein
VKNMRGAIAIFIGTLGLVSCAAPTASNPSPAAHTTTTVASSRPDPASFPKLTGAYGLLYSRTMADMTGHLHLVKADATLAASVPIQWNLQSILCAGSTDLVNIPPPVSASDGHVYLRDGSAIRMVVPPSTKVDVTTVPDSRSVISMFSVRPDDQKIAVVVVDTSSPTTITTRLYVEDLIGGGHHADIYTTSALKSSAPTTLWPMGWHKGNLVLAVVPACTLGLLEGPTEWHVSSPVTANRVATIKGSNCHFSIWPSPAGVACAQESGPTTLYDWGGNVVGVTGPGIPFTISNTGLSPAGHSIYFSGDPTRIVQLGPGPYASVDGHTVCGWIDEDHLLSTDAVIQFPAETAGNTQVVATARALPQSALPDPSTSRTSGCAGRFPGGL